MRNCLLVSEGVIHSLSPNSKLEPQTTRVKYRAARAAKTASKVVFVIFRLFPAASVVESCEGIWSQWSCPFSQALIRPLQVEWCFRYHVSVCKKNKKQQQRFAKLCYLKKMEKMPLFTKISSSVSHLPSFVSLLGEESLKKKLSKNGIFSQWGGGEALPNPNFLKPKPQPYKTVILLGFCRNMVGVPQSQSSVTQKVWLFHEKIKCLE